MVFNRRLHYIYLMKSNVLSGKFSPALKFLSRVRKLEQLVYVSILCQSYWSAIKVNLRHSFSLLGENIDFMLEGML